MSNNKPILTVAIPTRNRPEYLRQSLNSVLNQDFQDKRIMQKLIKDKLYK